MSCKTIFKNKLDLFQATCSFTLLTIKKSYSTVPGFKKHLVKIIFIRWPVGSGRESCSRRRCRRQTCHNHRRRHPCRRRHCHHHHHRRYCLHRSHHHCCRLQHHRCRCSHRRCHHQHKDMTRASTLCCFCLFFFLI
jgi:hypothetical protein